MRPAALSTGIKITDAITLELIDEQHAQPLLDLVNANRHYLHQWLPWVNNMQTPDNFKGYINRCKQQHEERSNYGYVIMLNNTLVGRIGIYYIDQENCLGAIGYWLGENFSGRGIVTQACIGLINHCFNHLNLNRIEIKCATENYKSAAIPERLRFKKEGVLRQAERVNGRFIDLNLYAMLKEEWK
jgi:ribosomal-protein-serine acetyltransferase